MRAKLLYARLVYSMLDYKESRKRWRYSRGSLLFAYGVAVIGACWLIRRGMSPRIAAPWAVIAPWWYLLLVRYGFHHV